MIILPLSIYFVIFPIARTKCLFSRDGYVKYNSCTFYTVQWLFHARLVSIESCFVRSFFLPRIVCAHTVPRIIMITRFYPLSRIDSSSSLCYELEHPALQRNFLIRILIKSRFESISFVYVNICPSFRSFGRKLLNSYKYLFVICCLLLDARCEIHENILIPEDL